MATRAGEDGPTLDFGSVQYLAPEGFDGAYQKDARLDIYALGMVSFELLLGEKAFRAECKQIYQTEAEISKKWANWQRDGHQQFRPLAQIDPSIPEYLSQLVARMLSKERQNRYADVTSISKDLHDTRRRESEEAEVEYDPNKTRSLGDSKKKAPDSPNRPHTSGSLQQKARSRKLLYIGGAISVVVFLILLFASAPNRLVSGSVTSNAGAELVIDKQRWGLIPANGTMHGDLPPGMHTVKLSLRITNDRRFSRKSKRRRPGPGICRSNRLYPSAPPLPPVPETPTRLDLPSGTMLLVPAGEFQYSSAKKRTTLAAFYMDETEVTNGAYRAFCDATSHPYPPNPFWDPDYLVAKEKHPVLNVTWDDAAAFAQWAGKRLPTELEWEKAARGTDGRTWPWGSEFDPKKANLGGRQDGFVYTAPVGSFPAGASPFGMLDMAGNVWEWVADAYGPPKDMGPNDRPLKGGAFVNGVGQESATTYFHGARPRTDRPSGVGFRCAKDAPLASAQASQPAAVKVPKE